MDGVPHLQDPSPRHRRADLSADVSARRCALQVVLLAALLLSPAVVAAPGRGSGLPPIEDPLANLDPLDYQGLSSPPASTAWHIPDYPLIEAMQGTILHTLSLCETQFEGAGGAVYGLLPAAEYGMIYVRDMSTMMPALPYFYDEEYLRTPLEEFLRLQYGPATTSVDGEIPGDGAISAVIAPDGHIDKASVVSDEELHLINAAFHYYKTVGGREWLATELGGETIIRRLNRAMEWLYHHRFDHTHQLIKRGHTTDWGDVKFEPSASPTDLDPELDHWACSIYDQALTYRALLQLAEMNRSLGDAPRAEALEARAMDLRGAVERQLWNSEAGFYLLHLHVTPLTHPFPEEEMVTISNAVVAYAGLGDPSQFFRALVNLERARLSAGATKPGLSIYPPYPPGFFAHPQMSPGEYQNGGLWDWWGGVQITCEFEGGLSALALAHLRMVAQDWALHPGQVFEWQMPSTGQGWGSANYASAAATMAEAVVRGLYGVTIDSESAEIRPRLRKHEGQVRAVQEASGLYVSYDYNYHPPLVVLDYGSNHPQGLEIGVLLPTGREIDRVSIDGEEVPYRTETLLNDQYCLFSSGSGPHRAIITLRNPSELGAPHTAPRSSSDTRPS